MKYLLLLLLLPVVLEAQQPDCNLAEKRFDNPISDTHGFVMRRYQWHVSYMAASTLIAEGIHRTTKLPRWASALTSTVAIGFLPHARGYVTGKYRVNVRDWAFDGVTRAAPLILWTGWSGQTWQSKTLAWTTLAGSYFSLACYASP